MESALNHLLDKLFNGTNIWLFTTEEDLPESFGQDMQDLFHIDPENDILSKVYHQADLEYGWCTDGVLVCIPEETDEVEAQKIIMEYIKEKGLSKAYIVLLMPDPNYAPYYKSYIYDNSTNEDLWEPYYDALCNEINSMEDEVLNLYFDYADAGLK